MPRGATAHDHAGKSFGSWIVLSRAANRGHKPAWLCRCVCGTERVVVADRLTLGKSQSCGCQRAGMCGDRNPQFKHGETGTPLHRAWKAMLSRCENPSHASYHRYGGRGIKVCERWHVFALFRDDLPPQPSPLHTLERIDNDGDYEPNNVRWATRREQARNTSRNLIVILRGKRMTLAEAVEIVGGSYSKIRDRLAQGKSFRGIAGIR